MHHRKVSRGLILSAGLIWTSAVFGQSSPVVHKLSDRLPTRAKTNLFQCTEDDRGGFYGTWVDELLPGKFFLRAQHFDADGKSLFSGPDRRFSGPLADFETWQAVADGKGGMTLLWDESNGVHMRHLRAGDNLLEDDPSVLLSTSLVVQRDAVPDAVGGLLLVWTERVRGDRPVLMAQRLDSEGDPVWPSNGLRVSLRASSQTNPRVIYDDMSGMIIAWRDQANEASELRVQRIDFSGNRLWGLEGIKVSAPMGENEFPNMAPLGAGGAALAWIGSVSQKSQVFLQKIGPDPRLQWPKDIHVAGFFNQWDPILQGDGKSGVWLAWEDFRNEVNYQIRMNHLSASGQPLRPQGDLAIASVPADQGKTAMTEDGKDGVWLAWIDNRNATVGLYGQQVGPNGDLLQGASGLRVSDHLRKPRKPRLANISPGRVVVCWTEQQKNDKNTLFWAYLGPNP